MVRSGNSHAIVLKRQDIRENDSLVLFYSKEQGRVSLLARGTKKPASKLIAHLEPLNCIDLMIIPGRGYSYVGSIKPIKSFFNIREDLDALAWVFAGINSFLRLVTAEGEKDERLYNLLYNYLSILDDIAAQKRSALEGEIAYAVFIFRLLTIIGYRPQTETCLSCKKSFTAEPKYFDLQNAGLLCGACFSPQANISQTRYLRVSDDSVKILRFILDEDKFLGKKIKFSSKLGHELANLVNKYLEFRL